MANSNRRYIEKNGKMFIPMNVEGGSWNDHFMTTPKLISLMVSVAVFVCMIAWLKSKYVGAITYIVFIVLYLFIFQFVLRYIIFEEKLYYKMYKNMKKYEISTPSVFWNIASLKETRNGAILTYGDAKIGIIVRLERDTITGKNTEFKEEHYDAISDFYRELVNLKYKFVQMNIMEQAGNDPRLAELDKLIFKSENENLKKLMERQVGYIKSITHKTLYESEYVLIYTNDSARIDAIMSDAERALDKILNGAYIGFKVLNARDIIEFIKEEYGVKYFNYTEATLSMYKHNNMLAKKPFKIIKIVYSNGKIQKVGINEINKINYITSGVLNGTINIDEMSIEETLSTSNNSVTLDGINFDSLSTGFDVEAEHKTDEQLETFTVNNQKDKFRKRMKKDKNKSGMVEKSELLGKHSDNHCSKVDMSKDSKIQQENNPSSSEINESGNDDDFIDF